MRALTDSTPFACDPEMLRQRAAEDGYLTLRGIPGPEAVAPLRALIQEVAESLGVSMVTVERDWRLARAWLGGQLRGGGE